METERDKLIKKFSHLNGGNIYNLDTVWICPECKHEGPADRRSSGNAVIDFYCKKCGKWMFDKDVS